MYSEDAEAGEADLRARAEGAQRGGARGHIPRRHRPEPKGGKTTRHPNHQGKAQHFVLFTSPILAFVFNVFPHF